MKGLRNNERLKTESASMATIKHCSLGVTALVLAISLAACGGGGSSGGGGEADEDSSSGFSVTAVTPADGESGVEPDAALTASFNKDLLASSIDSIELTKNNGIRPTNVPVSTRIDTASSVNIQPDEPLDILSEYTVTMTPDFSDSSGSPLSEAFPWSFVTRDGDWEQAGLIDSGTATAKQPDIAVDYDDNGWAMWLKEDSLTGNFNLIGRYYNAEDGDWEPQTLPLNSDETSSVSKPRVAVDLAGNAIVVWVQDDAVYARAWEAGSAADESGWSAVEKISGSDPVNDRTFLQVKFSGNSSARAVWLEGDAGTTVLASNNYWAPNAQWTGARSGPDLDIQDTSLAITDFAADNRGNAILLWVNSDEPSLPELENRVYATRYDADARDWVSTNSLETHSLTGEARKPKIVFDNQGNAFAAWSRTGDDFFSHLYVSHYDADSGAWSGSTRIMGARADSIGRFPSVAVDLQGNAMVAFEGGKMYVTYYRSDEAEWSGAQEIADYAATGLNDIVFDEDGNATLVWVKKEETARNIFSIRYAAVTESWDSPKRIESGGGGDAAQPVVGSHWGGSPITVWEDAGRIYTNRFSAE